MVDHTKKYIAPIVIATLMVIMMTVYIAACIFIKMPLVVMLIWGGICIFQIVITVMVLIERINEIRSGEEDDLSKY